MDLKINLSKTKVAGFEREKELNGFKVCVCACACACMCVLIKIGEMDGEILRHANDENGILKIVYAKARKK